MTDRRNADCPVVPGKLIDDAIRAYTQRVQAVQTAAQRVCGVRIPLEQSKRVLDSVDERPVEVEQMVSGAPRKNDFAHVSADGSTLAEVAAKVVERDAVASCQISEAGLDGG